MASISHHHFHPHPNYHSPNYKRSGAFDILKPLRHLVDAIAVKNALFAHILCRVIPCCCPFERNINLFGRTYHIPSLCKFNRLYNEVISLRFRALSFLSDECGQDVTKYIC